jgi:hypothetical protein
MKDEFLVGEMAILLQDGTEQHLLDSHPFPTPNNLPKFYIVRPVWRR